MNLNPYNSSLFAKTILLAEDDLDDQNFITEAFLKLDPALTVHAIANSNNVVPYLDGLADTHLPQLIVLDYNLPERDGAEVLALLATQPRYQAIPKIVWSTSKAPQYETRCLQLGAAVYLVKPSTIADIEAMARQMLESCFAHA